MMPAAHSLVALRRIPTPMLIVAGLHLGVLWVFLNGLQFHSAATAPAPDMIVEVIRPVPPVPETLHTTNVQPGEIKFKLPEPVPPDLRSPVEPAPTLQLDDEHLALQAVPDAGAGSAEPQPVINAAAVDPRHPLTQPPYPMSARRDGDAGALFLDLLVGADGKVRDAKVSRSSGFARLDQAAVMEAKQHWRLRAATRNGVPFEQWLTLRVVFKLEDR